MRELYSQDSAREDLDQLSEDDPFYESNEMHNLIGVANIFLSCLFHEDLEFDYFTPIISQQGEVAGRLQVGLLLPEILLSRLAIPPSFPPRFKSNELGVVFPLTDLLTVRPTPSRHPRLPNAQTIKTMAAAAATTISTTRILWPSE